MSNDTELKAALSRLRRVQGRFGMAIRYGHDGIADLQDELKALKAEVWILRALADAPPLSPEQRDRLAALLRGAE